MTEFAKRLNRLYEESELSQEAFGKLFNASRSQIFHWRNGNSEPDTETLRKIATVCNTSVDWLVGKVNIRTPIETILAQSDSADGLPPEALRSIEEFKELIQIKYRKNQG